MYLAWEKIAGDLIFGLNRCISVCRVWNPLQVMHIHECPVWSAL